MNVAARVFSALAAGGMVHVATHGIMNPRNPMFSRLALAPGGGVDTTGRYIGQKLNESWGQPVVADNRPGAGNNIGTEFVAKAPPDGYTIMVSASATLTSGIRNGDCR